MGQNAPYKRVDRVSDVLRSIISEVIATGVHHRGLEGVTITEVKVTPDLRHARAFYRVLDLNLREQVFHALQDVQKIIQKKMAAQLRTKYIPKLSFTYDESFEHGSRIHHLLNQVKEDAEAGDEEE